MSHTIRFVLALHNHQPVGNFDGVIEQAYQDSYRPFLDVFENYPSLRISLHTSGSLMEWLSVHHPEYIDRLAKFVAAGRIEVIGGAYYEPILSMTPRRDRLGQIRTYSEWLQKRLGCKVRGMWIPERVWESSHTSDLGESGIEYIILDDFHFRNAGINDEQLTGYYVTEDEGRLLAVFPGSERLRYLIPFADPHETIEYLGKIASVNPGAVVVFGDDGEKFGTWPETKKHVYEQGWLRRFFDALVANESWIKVTSMGEAIDHVPPAGKVYLPDCSYREMTEWVMPTERILEYDRLRHDMEHDPRWPSMHRFIRGGFWRNFKVKYPEADEMYTRMLMVSHRLEAAREKQGESPALVKARTDLYRAQCNCGYWHGAFGGIYLPHLRNAVYRHLISAENTLNKSLNSAQHWIEAAAGDFNLDARQEVYLTNDKLALLLSPFRGGQLYELDVRSICHNLLATLARRPEAYHQKIMRHTGDNGHGVASIHDRVIFKQPDLDRRLQYDPHPRKSLLDHFYDDSTDLNDVATANAAERGDFIFGTYEARLRRNPDRIQVQLYRQGTAHGHTIKITKGLTLEAGSSQIKIVYLLEGLPPGKPLHFGVEFNFAGLPSNADDRFFHDSQQHRLGHLGRRLDLKNQRYIGLTDEWLGIDVALNWSVDSHLWTFPIETVSQSEGGFELVHQSVVVQPHWYVVADSQGRWGVSLDLSVDTSLAESRQRRPLAASLAGSAM